MVNYSPKEIEAKWQEVWEKSNPNKAEDFSKKPKFYCLVEFPYPSGEGLHVGHLRSQTAMDILSRKKRMEGYNVLFPMGWDSFGLPTENYAIKTGVHPTIATAKNIARFKAQEKMMGYSFDWDREINTSDPEYYRWTQWLFLQFFKHDLAYKASVAINWCPACKIGLANEEVVEGNCERCGATAEKRLMSQWMLRITAYADKLLKGLEDVDYLESIKTQQQNWIGRSEGVVFKEKVKDLGIEFEVYDSIPQTYIAQTFTVIAPEHPMVKDLVKETEHEKPVMDFIEKIIKKRQQNQFELDKEPEGIFTGRYVENPFGTGDLPIWVASYVVADYGTGIVNCSAHDERDFKFAKKYKIPLKIAMLPKDKELAERVKNFEVFYGKDPEGIIQAPEEFKGLTWENSRDVIIKHIEQKGYGYRSVQFKLRDWVFSRQHYWGEPIPIIICPKCGFVPVSEKDLPVELPKVENYLPTDTGESPLAAISEWVNVKCPICNEPAKRETDTMPNWAGSSWYFMRYLDPHNDKEFCDKKKQEYWMPVDLYSGGMEHTTLHLLYSRFWQNFLYDIGLTTEPEPYAKRISHGMILAEDGRKMSKSFGNVVNPDEVVQRYGADTVRAYEMFMGPFDQTISWSNKGMEGVYRFLSRVWYIITQGAVSQTDTSQTLHNLHRTIKKVSEDIERFHFNTAVSSLMELSNYYSQQKDGITIENKKTFLLLLAPFAPHLAEECWQILGGKESVFQSPWPVAKDEFLKAEKMTIVIQVNSRVRDKVELSTDLTENAVKEAALKSPLIEKWLAGKKIKNLIYIPTKLINIVTD